MKLVRFEPRAQPAPWLPRMDVVDLEDRLVVRLEIPGVPADDIDIDVDDRTLSISATRTFDAEHEYRRREIPTGRFTRRVLLPEGVDSREITAATDDGILSVSIPRRPEVLPRRVKVDVVAN